MTEDSDYWRPSDDLESLREELLDTLMVDCESRHVRRFGTIPCACRDLYEDLIKRFERAVREEERE